MIDQLKGLEGWRVELRRPNGEVERFIVALSRGPLKVHIALKHRRSPGGRPVTWEPGSTVRKLYRAKPAWGEA